MPIGPAYNADSTNVPSSSRFGRLNEAIVGQVHGKYYEATSRGNVYSATSTTGRAPGTALGVAPPIALYNPVGSGKRAKIMKVTAVQAATGTLGTGVLMHCGFTINGPTGSQSNVVPVVGSGAAITPINVDIGAANASVLQAWSLPTLNANPAALYPFCQLAESVGGTTAVNPSVVTEDVDGNIVLEPGTGWCLEGVAAAGSTPLIIAGVVWEEIPVG